MMGCPLLASSSQDSKDQKSKPCSANSRCEAHFAGFQRSPERPTGVAL